MAARRGYASKGTGDDLDDARIPRVRRQSEHPIVGVGVPEGEALFSRLAEHVGREVHKLLGDVLDRVTLDYLSESRDGFLRFFRADHDLLATVAAPALEYELLEVLHYVPPI